MEREHLSEAPVLIELGTASVETQGGPSGYIEVTGFLRANGISEE